MTPAERLRAIQRLDARCWGWFDSLRITCELQDTLLSSEWDGHQTTFHYSAHPTPMWTVHLRRPGYKHWTWDLMGFNNNVTVEAPDLDAALTMALEKSEPRRVYLDERVWEHLDFLDLFDFLPLTPEQIEAWKELQ